MTRWPTLVVSLALLLSACSVTPSQGRPSGDVSTAGPASTTDDGLAARRQAADIADCDPPTGGAEVKQGGLPSLELHCLASTRSVDLSQLRGTPMIINVWAFWCGPCRAEAPVLSAFAERAGAKVQMLGIDYSDPSEKAALDFAISAGWKYPQLIDPSGAIGPQLGIAGIPVTLLVSADGMVVYRFTGAVTSVDQLAAAVKERLGVDV